MANSFNYKIGDNYYDLVPAEVVGVNYTDKNPENLYSIKIKLLHRDSAQNPGDILSARPLNHNVKRMPLNGEIVFIVKGPTAYGAGLTETTENYYVDTFSVQNSVHHNSFPKRHFVPPGDAGSEGISDAQNGIPTVEDSNDVKTNLANSFNENGSIRPLQPFAGDVLMESRVGSSLRFGSSLESFDDYSKQPSWKKANGNIGDPIVIIRNGQRSDVPSEPNKFVIEDIDKDKSSIYMTSTQRIKFNIASSNLTSISDKGVDSFNDSPKFSGAQIGLFSDRIIMNSRKNEFVIFSKKGIGGSTEGNISWDTDDTFEINASNRINLGFQGDEPALMGDTSGDWLDQLMTVLGSLCDALSLEIHGTGTGPSTPPINAPQYIAIKGQLTQLQARIPTLKSQLVYLNKK